MILCARHLYGNRDVGRRLEFDPGKKQGSEWKFSWRSQKADVLDSNGARILGKDSLYNVEIGAFVTVFKLYA